jgi:hypothetical protein
MGELTDRLDRVITRVDEFASGMLARSSTIRDEVLSIEDGVRSRLLDTKKEVRDTVQFCVDEFDRLTRDLTNML